MQLMAYLFRITLAFCTVSLMVPGVFAFHASPTRQGGITSRLVQVTRLEAAASSAVEDTKSSRWSLRRLFHRRNKELVNTNVDFDSILQTRRTINEFEEELPSNWNEMLEKAILSAIYAPNHKRTEPWRFHLLGKKAIQKVCELNASLVAAKKGEAAGKKKLDRWLLMPGWLVVTCKTSDGESSMDVPASIEREDYAACCCAVQNLCLSLHNSGMGTKWTTGPVNFDARFGEIVGLDKNEYVVGTIWFGTPKQKPNAPPKKQKLEDVLIKHS